MPEKLMRITIKSTALSYIPLPRFLLDDGELSSDAKLLYALLLDRASISKLNGFTESDGTIRVYFTVEQAQKSYAAVNSVLQEFSRNWKSAG